MKTLICSDKFKGSLTSLQVSNIVTKAILSIDSKAQIEAVEMADGGEGSLEALVSNGGRIMSMHTVDALGRTVDARYVVLDNSCCVIELASSVGLGLLKKDEYNPEKTSTYGFGLMMKQAINLGYKKFILCIGGSATNDAGMGFMSALGVNFYNNKCELLTPNGKSLSNIHHIDITDSFLNLTKDIQVEVACDVDNPLYGEYGAAWVYAPQKGADNDMCKRLDDGLRNWSDVVGHLFNTNPQDIVGGGAAGGIGAALNLFLKAIMRSGATLIADNLNLDSKIKNADIVITGEGRIDNQTFRKKLPMIIAMIAKKYNKRCIVLCGDIMLDSIDNNSQSIIDLLPEDIRYEGIEIYKTREDGMTTQYSINNVEKLLYNKVVSIF